MGSAEGPTPRARLSASSRSPDSHRQHYSINAWLGLCEKRLIRSPLQASQSRICTNASPE